MTNSGSQNGPSEGKKLDSRIRDLTGLRVNTLVVERYLQTKPQGNAGKLGMAVWECRCIECGALQPKTRRYLVQKKAVCSECHRRADQSFVGRRFGRLEVVELADAVPGSPDTYWEVACDCGNRFTVRRSSLTLGDTRSCGCLKQEGLPEVLADAREKRWDAAWQSKTARPRRSQPHRKP